MLLYLYSSPHDHRGQQGRSVVMRPGWRGGAEQIGPGVGSIAQTQTLLLVVKELSVCFHWRSYLKEIASTCTSTRELRLRKSCHVQASPQHSDLARHLDPSR